jgi:hypothetical protein
MACLHSRWSRDGGSIFIAAVGGTVLAGFIFSFVSVLSSLRNVDFLPMYVASHLVATGHGSEMYSHKVLGVAEGSLLHVQLMHHGLPYLNPPFIAALLTPIGAMPYSAAYWIWMGVNVVLAVCCVVLLTRTFCCSTERTGWNMLAVGLALASSLPVFVCLIQGQLSLLLLLGVCCCGLALQRQRYVLAGVASAVLLGKPQFAIPVICFFLVVGLWKTLLGFSASAVGLGTLGVLTSGWRALTAWIHVALALRSTRAPGFAPSVNYGLPSVFLRYLSRDSADVAAGLVVCVVLALTVLFYRRAKWHSLLDDLSLAITTGLLISPHLLVHDLAILAFPVANLSRRLSARSFASLAGSVWVACFVGPALYPAAAVPLPTLSVLAVFALTWRPRPTQEIVSAPTFAYIKEARIRVRETQQTFILDSGRVQPVGE